MRLHFISLMRHIKIRSLGFSVIKEQRSQVFKNAPVDKLIKIANFMQTRLAFLGYFNLFNINIWKKDLSIKNSSISKIFTLKINKIPKLYVIQQKSLILLLLKNTHVKLNYSRSMKYRYLTKTEPSLPVNLFSNDSQLIVNI